MTAGKDERSNGLARFAPLAVLLALVGCIHFALRATGEAPVLWGDETHYLGYAMLDAAEGTTGLLPGTLPFDHRPELASRVFAQLADPEDPNRSFRRIEGLQTALLLALVALTWLQARALALGPATSLGAAAFVGLFPWLAFHAHALWPELLHAVLLGGAVLALTYALNGRGLAWFAGAGLALGFAMLAKGTFLPLTPIVIVLAGLVARERRVLSALLFAAAVTLVVGPQLVANANAGHGFRLSANTWWNLELGLTDLGALDPERVEQAKQGGMPDGMVRWLPVVRASMAYFEAAEDPVERERLSRERTLEYLGKRGVLGVAGDQLRKTARLLLAPEPSLDQSATYRQRWGESAPGWLRAVRLPARVLWFVVLALALAGCLGVIREPLRAGGAWLPVLLLVVYLFAALTLVPVKFRFLLPALPLLALLASAGGERLCARCRSPRA